MIAFLDTEFTDLVIHPRLLSVGLVADVEPHREFYAEVTDRDRIDATNWFGLGSVLPQFGKVACAACTYAELGARLSNFLGELVTDLPRGDAREVVELAFGYHLDWELLDLAISDCKSTSWAATRRRVRPVNVYARTGFGAGKLATEAYFRSQQLAPFSRHHALCDARALRLAYAATSQRTAVRISDEASRVGPTRRVAAG